MSNIGRMVLSTKYGEGRIESFDQSSIMVYFAKFQKFVTFEYPMAFQKELQAKDADFASEINKDINACQKNVEKFRRDREMLAAAKRQQDNAEMSTTTPRKVDHYKKVNIAFKCTFCDGGKSPQQVGFNGVCSDRMIDYNIRKKKRVWCSQADCACNKYINEPRKNRVKLDALCRDGGYVCYESQMLREWKAYAGMVHNGAHTGETMKFRKVQSDSLCVLTTREPDMEESDRYIFAVFLITDFKEGDNKDEGCVSTRSEYRIKLAPQEVCKMPYWKYHANEKNSGNPVWSTGLHRYFEDDEAAIILRDIAALKKGTKKEALAERFFHHFCQINYVDEATLGQPKGALTRQSKNRRDND